MMLSTLMNAKVFTEVGYNLHKCFPRWCVQYKVWLWMCWEGQERLLRHITAACDQQTIISLSTNTEFKDDINYFY